MAPNVTNCIRCNKVFRKTVSDKCPACAAREQDQFSHLYQLLQESRLTGGIHAKELAMKVGMSQDVVEEFYLEGKLGTSSHFVNFTCKNCKEDFSGKEGHSRICIRCRSQVSVEAGVGIHSIADVEKRVEEDKRRQAAQLRLKGSAAAMVQSSKSSENTQSGSGQSVAASSQPAASAGDTPPAQPEAEKKPKLSLKTQAESTSASESVPTRRSAGLKRID